MTAADLYNDRILALARSRTGAGQLEGPCVRVSRDNPLCGDRISLDLRLEGGRIVGLAHRTRGCLLTEAAAALVAQLALGMTPGEAQALVRHVQDLLAGRPCASTPGELRVFAPVAAVKSRHDCVLLPFAALAEAAASANA
ncbi:Iron-sulfur cluster assembly scaffold protein IscU [bacterium HR40]|nr:Iron-sulfur cluster assembly scaffold protein IscU [bacterium HR40]